MTCDRCSSGEFYCVDRSVPGELSGRGRSVYVGTVLVCVRVHLCLCHMCLGVILSLYLRLGANACVFKKVGTRQVGMTCKSIASVEGRSITHAKRPPCEFPARFAEI